MTDDDTITIEETVVDTEATGGEAPAAAAAEGIICAVVTGGDLLAVRDCPNGKKAGELADGDEVTITNIEDEWAELAQGGYTKSRYLRPVRPA